MNVLQSVFGSLIMLGLFGCVTASSEDSIPLRSLAKGGFSGIQEAKQEVITEKKAWEQIWSKHSKSRTPAAAPPEVDFEKEMVIAVTMGSKRTGGYAVEIARVEITEKKLKILVKESSPPPGAMTLQALTAPFHFVAVPKSNLKPEFVKELKPAEKKQ
jgi:hypothetical protein